MKGYGSGSKASKGTSKKAVAPKTSKGGKKK